MTIFVNQNEFVQYNWTCESLLPTILMAWSTEKAFHLYKMMKIKDGNQKRNHQYAVIVTCQQWTSQWISNHSAGGSWHISLLYKSTFPCTQIL